MAKTTNTTPRTAEEQEKIDATLRVMTKDQRAKAWSSLETGIKHAGTQIILPAVPFNMTEDEAIDALNRVKAENAQKFDVHEVIPGIPWDAAVATYKALQDLYGVVTSKTAMTFFGPKHPSFLSVKTGPAAGEVLQIPIGDLQLPTSKATFKFGIFDGGAYIRGTVNKRDKERLVQIAALASELMKKESIYKGKAIRVNATDEGGIDMSNQPEFIDLSTITPDMLVHNAVAADLIDTNIFSPLMNTAQCRRNGIPLKRGILLEGTYGTGKTLTALVTAKIATDNGWTFIMLNRCNGLAAALDFSKLIQPVAVFTEDLDRFADRTNESVNDLINTLDGLDTKTNEVLVVVTTNHIELFDKALLRPGRFDAVISLLPPDPETVQKLIVKYAKGKLEPGANLKEVGDILAGQVPASIAEVVKRAFLANMQRGRDEILVRDLVSAATGMKRHFELLSEDKGVPTKQELLYASMKDVVNSSVEDHIAPQTAILKRIADAVV